MKKQKRITLRIDSDLHKEISEIAEKCDRSVNKQIACMLKRDLSNFFDIPKRKPKAAPVVEVSGME